MAKTPNLDKYIGSIGTGTKDGEQESTKAFVERKSASDNKAKATKEEELRYRLRLMYYKKFNGDVKKIEEATNKKLQELDEKRSNYKKKLAKEEHEEYLKQLEEEVEFATSRSEKMQAVFKLAGEQIKDQLKEDLGKSLGNAIGNAIGGSIKAALGGIEKGVGIYTTYMSSIEARIQGGEKSFSGMLDTIKRNLAVSPYVKQTAVIDNLNNLINQGILYNVELRAFLETISDKIATTFDATNGTLLRLIRIQQADTTASRLGLEANLTRYLNATYQDTSYLNQGGVFDTVSSALMEAISLAGRDRGVELEYVIQKWLGSLYSVGASESFISSLAQGLGYLGSGDIGALSSNTALQNLLVMGASRAGLDYSKILTTGLSPAAANQLLSSIVRYVQEINRSNNIVVKSQYAQLFGMTISDMTSLLNLSSEDLRSISQNMLSYSQTIGELEYQLGQVGKRTHIAELIDNILDNTLLTLGTNVANSAYSYGIYRAGQILDDITGSIKLPVVSAAGFSVDLGMTYGQLLSSGAVNALTVIPTLVQAISSMVNRGGLKLSGWGGLDYTSRGTGIVSTPYGVYEGTSSSAIIGGSGEGYAEDTLAGAKEQAQSFAGNEESEGEQSIKNIENSTFSILELLRDVISGTRSFTVNIDRPGGNYSF